MRVTVNLEKIRAELEIGTGVEGGLKRRMPGQLTPREIACLNLYLQGVMAAKIAEDWKVARATVYHHLMRIRLQLRCSNDAELFFLCYERGYVTLDHDQMTKITVTSDPPPRRAQRPKKLRSVGSTEKPAPAVGPKGGKVIRLLDRARNKLLG